MELKRGALRPATRASWNRGWKLSSDELRQIAVARSVDVVIPGSSIGDTTPQLPCCLSAMQKLRTPTNRMLLGSTRSSSVRTTMRLLSWRVLFGSPTSRATLEHVSVMQQAVKHRALIAAASPGSLPPVLHRTV